MKVKVNVKTSPKAQEKYYEQAIAEAYAEMEAMFQENKDLRVSEGHLRDDLARAQVLIAELETELAELTADYDALVQTKREYGEEIDRLRKVVTNLQTNRFTYEEVIKMIMNHVVPSTDQ